MIYVKLNNAGDEQTKLQRFSPARLPEDERLVRIGYVQGHAHLSNERLAQWFDRRPVVLPEIVMESGTFFTTGNKQGKRLSA